MRKVLSLMLALVMCLSLSAPALAVGIIHRTDATVTDEGAGSYPAHQSPTSVDDDSKANCPGSMANFKIVNHSPVPFTDVPEGHWAEDVIGLCWYYGFMKGTDAANTRFNYNGYLTFAEAVTMAARIHQIYTDGVVTLQNGSPWYQTYFDYAREHKILPEMAISDAQAANSYITREVMAYLYAMALPFEELPALNSIESIPDMDDSSNYTGYVLHLYNAGVLVGSDAFGTFNPDTPIIRAEAAAILARVALPEMRRQNTLVEHWSFPQWHEKSTIAVERDAEHEINDSGHHTFSGANSLVYVTLEDVGNESITELDTAMLADLYLDNYELIDGMPIGRHDLAFGDTPAHVVTFTWYLNGFVVPSALLFVIDDGVFMTAQYSFITFLGEEEYGFQMVERMVNNTGITGYALNQPLVFTR